MVPGLMESIAARPSSQLTEKPRDRPHSGKAMSNCPGLAWTAVRRAAVWLIGWAPSGVDLRQNGRGERGDVRG